MEIYCLNALITLVTKTTYYSIAILTTVNKAENILITPSEAILPSLEMHEGINTPCHPLRRDFLEWEEDLINS